MSSRDYSANEPLSGHLRRFQDPKRASYLIERSRRGWDRPGHYARSALQAAREAGQAPHPPARSDEFEVGAIEITNTCNLKCPMCRSDLAARPRQLMPPDVFERLVLRLKEAGIGRTALHTVGEPLLHGRLPELLEIAARHGVKVWISTNAQFPKVLETILRGQRRALSSIRISVDAATPATFAELRPGGRLDKVMESLEIIRRLNQGQPDCEFNLNLHAVVSMANIGELPLIFRTFTPYSWQEQILFSLVNGLSPDPSFFRRAFPFPGLIAPTVPCLHPFRHMTILNDGRATLCCADFEGELTIGAALATPLSVLWNSPEAQDIRRQHLEPKGMRLRSCRDCYEPLAAAGRIFNDFVHFLWLHSPDLPAHEFGERAVSLLRTMEQAMLQNEAHRLPDRIRPFFRR